MKKLTEMYADEVQAILAKYPPEQKRSAVMPLLYLAQRRDGFVTKDAMQEVGEICGITATEVASVVGFYSLYHDEKAGTYRIQVCTDLPCALRGAEEFLQKLCENLGIQVGETTPDGKITVERVMCLAACDKAPMFQVQSMTEDGKPHLEYHENQTIESATRFIEELRRK
ncbi:MAG: NAD(P)H-dependent oxidoreductase subunit E [Anaerolineales bacterium]|nr:NAD(P)H-dependent oxidoreductase subunit E [Anaerolineales bacterium]